MKKLLSILCAVAMVCALLPTGLIAAAASDFTYTVENEEATITGYNGTPTALVIPSEIDGYAVTAIGEKAFYRCTSLTSVMIPDSVTSIGDFAFDYCNALTRAYYRGTSDDWAKVEIGVGNEWLIDVPWYGDVVEAVEGEDWSYVIRTDGTVAITDYNGTAAELVVPSHIDGYAVTTIGEKALFDCDTLTSVVISEGVTSLGSYAIAYCHSLTSVVLPDSVSSIGSCAFDNDPKLTDVVLPDSVTSIGSYAFNSCKALTDIVIPDSVTSIGSYLFNNCSSLTRVGLPKDLKTIVQGMFSRCTSLTSIDIPAGVTSIGYTAFDTCTSLTSVVIPEGVTAVGDYAFRDCRALSKVYYRGTEEERAAISIGKFNDPLLNTAWICNVKSGGADDTILYTVTAGNIASIVGYVGNETDVKIPDAPGGYTVTAIEAYAFAGCASLASIEIPASVTAIGDYAFDGCDALSKVRYGGDKTDRAVMWIGANNMRFAAATWEYNVGNVVVGDMSGDGVLDTMDALLLFGGLNGARELTEAQEAAADYNGDGVLNMMDALLLYKFVSGQ